MNKFTIHACEQVLRFSRVEKWGDLSEERKFQLAFNVGAMSLGLNLNKEDGFLSLANMRQGVLSMNDFREHIKALVISHGIKVNEANITKEF